MATLQETRGQIGCRVDYPETEMDKTRRTPVLRPRRPLRGLVTESPLHPQLQGLGGNETEGLPLVTTRQWSSQAEQEPFRTRPAPLNVLAQVPPVELRAPPRH